MKRTEVRAGYPEDAGREGWVYGLPLAEYRQHRPTGRRWVTIPGSDYGATLYPTPEAASAARDAAYVELCRIGEYVAKSLGEPYEPPARPDFLTLCRVRSVYRYRRNWFEAIGEGVSR